MIARALVFAALEVALIRAADVVTWVIHRLCGLHPETLWTVA